MKIEKSHFIWDEVKEKLEELNNKIFEGVDKSKLSDYEKRKMIFMYLCNNTKYDFDGLTDMILFSLRFKYDFDSIGCMDIMKQYKIISEELKKSGNEPDQNLVFQILRRIKAKGYKKNFSNIESLNKLIEEGIGLCNSDSQLYKILLEMNEIYSAVYICDNGELRLHALNLVYDKESDSYSFDDISTYTAASTTQSVNPEDFFDYDLEYGNKTLNQGHMPTIENVKDLFNVNGIPMSDNRCYYLYKSIDINYFFDRKDNNWYEQFDLEQNGNVELPESIVSLKNKGISI